MEHKTKPGIYYIVRCPKGWELIANPYENGDGPDHSEWWETTVAGIVATKWAKRLRTTPAALEQQIKLLAYAFPRGRVTEVGEGQSMIYHGCDFRPHNHKFAFPIVHAFDVAGVYHWKIDEHEHCQQWDKDEMRRILRIREDWKAV